MAARAGGREARKSSHVPAISVMASNRSWTKRGVAPCWRRRMEGKVAEFGLAVVAERVVRAGDGIEILLRFLRLLLLGLLRGRAMVRGRGQLRRKRRRRSSRRDAWPVFGGGWREKEKEEIERREKTSKDE